VLLARVPSFLELLFNLPYVVVLLWLVWTILTPMQVGYLLNKKRQQRSLAKHGELFSFREVMAVGCVGGFILLTFITAFCCWVTWSAAGLF
jgi:hypothetical protein